VGNGPLKRNQLYVIIQISKYRSASTDLTAEPGTSFECTHIKIAAWILLP